MTMTEKEKIILDNRSSKPLCESYEMAFDCYFQYWSDEVRNYVVVNGEFKFYVQTNKTSISIQIYDNN